MIDLFAHVAHSLTVIKDGWCSPEKAHCLACIITALRPELTVEIGVFAGRSIIPMAIAHKVINKGKVVGIDPYSVEAAAIGQEGQHKDWWEKESSLNRIHDEFVANIKLFQLEDRLTLIRAKSDDVEPLDNVDVIHIDGNHSDQAIRDVKRFAAKVRIGGLCICDDIDWPGGGVVRAVEHLKEIGFIPLYPLDGGGVFQRIK